MQESNTTVYQILQAVPLFFLCALEKSPTSEKISDSPFEKYRLCAAVFWQ